MPITIAICEDEPNIRMEIAGMIQRRGDYSPDSFDSADALLKSGKEYDICILDIQMPGVNGMELAKKIRSRGNHPGPIIIFVTAFREYMQDAFDVQAYHFLTKPIDEEKFHAVLAGAVMESERRSRREHITVKISGASYTLPLDEIFFVESLGKKVAIHTRKDTLECYGKIGEIAGKLEGSPMFFRCHRCYIVNLEHISGFGSKSIRLANGREVHLAREKHQGFLKAYAQYAMK